MSASELDEVIARAAPALFGYFLHRVPSADDAADLVSETMIAAWKASRRRPGNPEEARMWLFGIARNSLRHHVRGGLRRDALTERLARAAASSHAPDGDAALDLRSAVDALPRDLAELIKLVHWDGFTVEDAATHLGIHPSTARSRHARAKHLLRETLSRALA